MTAPTIEKILADFELAASIISEVGPIANVAAPGIGTAIGAGAALALKLLVSIQAGVKAHEAITGKPLDLTTLHTITPV